MKHAKLALGLLLVVAGIALALRPQWIIDARGVLPRTESDVINVRATFGGTLIGLGAFAAWLPAWKPWLRAILGVLGWAMAGIGAARLLGFVLDGNPDYRQAIWIVAEVLLVIGCAYGIRRLERGRR